MRRFFLSLAILSVACMVNAQQVDFRYKNELSNAWNATVDRDNQRQWAINVAGLETVSPGKGISITAVYPIIGMGKDIVARLIESYGEANTSCKVMIHYGDARYKDAIGLEEDLGRLSFEGRKSVHAKAVHTIVFTDSATVGINTTVNTYTICNGEESSQARLTDFYPITNYGIKDLYSRALINAYVRALNGNAAIATYVDDYYAGYVNELQRQQRIEEIQTANMIKQHIENERARAFTVIPQVDYTCCSSAVFETDSSGDDLYVLMLDYLRSLPVEYSCRIIRQDKRQGRVIASISFGLLDIDTLSDPKFTYSHKGDITSVFTFDVDGDDIIVQGRDSEVGYETFMRQKQPSYGSDIRRSDKIRSYDRQKFESLISTFFDTDAIIRRYQSDLEYLLTRLRLYVHDNVR